MKSDGIIIIKFKKFIVTSRSPTTQQVVEQTRPLTTINDEVPAPLCSSPEGKSANRNAGMDHHQYQLQPASHFHSACVNGADRHAVVDAHKPWTRGPISPDGFPESLRRNNTPITSPTDRRQLQLQFTDAEVKAIGGTTMSDKHQQQSLTTIPVSFPDVQPAAAEEELFL